LIDPRGTVVFADFGDPSVYDNAGEGALFGSILVKSKLSGLYTEEVGSSFNISGWTGPALGSVLRLIRFSSLLGLADGGASLEARHQREELG